MLLWWSIAVAPPVALILLGLLHMGEGKNVLAVAYVGCGILQVGALNKVTVLQWISSLLR